MKQILYCVIGKSSNTGRLNINAHLIKSAGADFPIKEPLIHVENYKVVINN